MNNFDLNLLRIFEALWRYGHVGRAAAALSLSQPAFSYSLKRLRDQIGDPLFVKTRTGMQPTTHALRLAPIVATILAQVRDELLPVPAFDPLQSARTFTLSTSDIGEMVILPKLIRHLSRVAPNVNIRTYGGGPAELRLAMENSELDLLIGYFPDAAGTDIFQQRLFSHGFSCIARRNHPALSKKLSLQRFLELPHAVIRAEGRSQEIVEQYFKEQGVKRRALLSTHHFLSIPFVIAATDMVVTVPSAVAEMFALLATIQIFNPPMQLPSFDIKQYWHRRQHYDAANQWLRGEILQLFSGKSTWHLEKG